MVDPRTDEPAASSPVEQIRVVAVADSDSYLKWACATLDGLAERHDPGIHRTAVLVRSPLTPTPTQTAAAVANTAVVRPQVVGPRRLGRVMQDLRPDVVLVAATGPVAELVARTVVAATRPHRPALISGLPGMALPATPFGTGWRRWSDAFVVHSHREVEEYRREFEAQGAHPRIALARLPFLGRPFDPAVPPTRLVFAPQSIVPASRTERVRLLDGLARVAATGSEVLVKLRARSGERQTHNEAFPLDQLWDAVHDDLGQPGDALRFVDGPMAEWLVPGTALATVSSTAALESLSLGLPTVLIDDFGVAPRLLNEPFIGSGCFASLDELPSVLAAGGPLPDSTWKQRNYLHTGPSELPAVVQELALARRSGDLSVLRSVAPFSWPRHMRTVVRSALPGAVTKRLVRPPR